VNERNLSRKLSTNVVDALKAHGHILVVKGGATALARELDELMAPEIAAIVPRLALAGMSMLVGEPTSTFGDERIDEAVEEMVKKLTRALMSSDHVEDVFAEDGVIRRDIFRVVRDGLREPPAPSGEDETVTVKLDTLGYVAATASRLTDASTLRQALDRAASDVAARFTGFSPEQREATFRLEGGGPDERLELEEAVADALTDLVEEGIVELPTIERRIDLGRALAPAELRALKGRIEKAAETTIHRSGCAADWDLADARTLRILYTPLSEHDADAVDAPTRAFAKEVAAILGAGPDGAASGPNPRAAPGGARPAVKAEAPAPVAKPAEAPREVEEPAPRSAQKGEKAAAKKKAAPVEVSEAPPSSEKAVAAKKTAAKKTAKKRAAPSSKKTAAKAAPSEPAAAAPRARATKTSRAATPSRPAAKAPAKKR
jgi:hypothetical protein